MRIGLIGDTHGFMPALEAALAGCRDAACELIVHCGDFLSSPFSPDPPSETITLLRAADVSVVVGNGEVYLRDWGTPRWEATLAQRRQRPDPPDYFLPYRRTRLSAPAFRHGDGHPLARKGDLCTAALIVVCSTQYH